MRRFKIRSRGNSYKETGRPASGRSPVSSGDSLLYRWFQNKGWKMKLHVLKYISPRPRRFLSFAKYAGAPAYFESSFSAPRVRKMYFQTRSLFLSLCFCTVCIKGVRGDSGGIPDAPVPPREVLPLNMKAAVRQRRPPGGGAAHDRRGGDRRPHRRGP